MDSRLSRRRFVRITSASVAGIAVGCVGDDDAATPGPGSGSDAGASGADTGGPSGDAAGGGDGSEPLADTPPAEDGGAPADADRPDAQTEELSEADPGAGADTDPETALSDATPATDSMQDAADDAADYDAAETGADAAPDAAVAPAFDPEAVPASAERFPMGVRAGDATGEGAVFATRFDGGDPLVLTVFADGQGPGAIAAEAPAVAGEAGDVYVELAGLAAGTWYRYAFRQAGGSPAFRSPLGRIRTALPDTSLEPVVFGACSCTKAAYAPFGAIGEAAADALDFFLLLGDTVYADGSHSLADYRASWQETVGRPEYAALLGSTGIMATWDDHEVANNWNPETHPAAEVAAAKQALLEHLPIRRHPEGRLWRSYRWGRTLEVFILDCRGERKPSTRQGPDAQYISPEQLAWLQEALAGSPAAFKIIANSVPITDMPPLYVSEDDRWEGYAAQREALLGFIADQGIGGVVFLAGDFHFPCVAHIEPPDAPLHPVYEILCGPGAQIPNPAWLILTGDGIFGNQFEWASAVNNYTRFIADPSDMTLAVEFVTPTGTVEYSTVLSIA